MKTSRRTTSLLPVFAVLAAMAATTAFAQSPAASAATPPAAPSAVAMPAGGPGAALPAPAAVQQPAAADNAAIEAYGISFRDAWRYGGNIMYLLSLLSVFGLALVVYLLVVLRPAAVVPRTLRMDLSDKLRAGDAAGARRACEARPCPLAAVALAALDYLGNAPRVDRDLLKDAMESEGARQAQTLESMAQWLLDLSVVAPMLGLLGTVLGMLKAFGSVAHDVAAAKPIILAQGVSQAIVTTIFGLFVAIPALAFFAWLRRRAARQVSLLEAATTDVLADILSREEP